ncbi:hypothetical protein DENSPDRAFT_749552, partial [Dentipellis sp. KUC8613]
VTRRPGEEYLPGLTAPTYHSGRKSIMIWACIAHGVKGPIIKLDLPPVKIEKKGRRRGGGMGAREYVAQILSGPLKDFVKDMESRRGHDMLVVEDGAPGH